MARKMFKQLARLEEQNVGHTGSATVLCAFEKQQDGMVSAYLDKVRYSFVADISGYESDKIQNLGYLFWLSTSNSDSSSEFVISASAARGNGGVISLDCKRSIKENSANPDTGFGRVYLWCSTTDPDLTAGDITIHGYVEAFGRWHQIINA